MLGEEAAAPVSGMGVGPVFAGVSLLAALDRAFVAGVEVLLGVEPKAPKPPVPLDAALAPKGLIDGVVVLPNAEVVVAGRPKVDCPNPDEGVEFAPNAAEGVVVDPKAEGVEDAVPNADGAEGVAPNAAGRELCPKADCPNPVPPADVPLPAEPKADEPKAVLAGVDAWPKAGVDAAPNAAG